MADAKPRADAGDGIKEYAGGWISERKDTAIPPFLKFAYLVIALGCTAYGFLYMNGEESHATRGPLVRQLNADTGTADGFMYFVLLLALVFAGVLAAFAFGSSRREE